MRNGLLGSSAPSDAVIITGGVVTLRPDLEYWVTGAATLRLPASIPAGKLIHVVNATTNAIVISRGGGAMISGVARSTGAAITNATSVRLFAGMRAVFVASNGSWIAQGCESPALVFAYNGTPLSSNSSNPSSASDLFHWLWIQNNNTNPAGTSWLTSVGSSTIGTGEGPVSVLSNRAAPTNTLAACAHTATAANSWFGWQLPAGYSFRPTGVLLLTRGDNNGQYPRDFTIRVANGSTLTSGTSVGSWTAAQVFTNQSQIAGTSTWHFVSISTAQSGRQLAFEQQQNSTADFALVLQEVCWFGELSVT